MRTIIAAAITGLALFVPVVSQASLIFTLEQISATEITVTASGTFDGPTPGEFPAGVYLIDPFAIYADATAALANNTLSTDRPASLLSARAIDGLGINSVGSNLEMLELIFSADNIAGDTIAGSVDLTLPGNVLELIGSTGDVWYGANDGNELEEFTGTWQIIGAQVPEPPVLSLLVMGLLGARYFRSQR